MEQLIVLALVVVFFVGKNLLKKMMGRGDAEESPDVAPRPIAQSPTRRTGGGERKMGEQEEKMRKFFEALGLPTDSLPPPAVAPKKSQPPPLVQSATPPPMAKKARPKQERPRPPEMVRPAFMPDAPTSVQVQAGSLAGPQMASPAEMYASTHISAPALRPVSQQDISPAAVIALELRRSPFRLRRAVVINELLGKPLALR